MNPAPPPPARPGSARYASASGDFRRVWRTVAPRSRSSRPAAGLPEATVRSTLSPFADSLDREPSLYPRSSVVFGMTFDDEISFGSRGERGKERGPGQGRQSRAAARQEQRRHCATGQRRRFLAVEFSSLPSRGEHALCQARSRDRVGHCSGPLSAIWLLSVTAMIRVTKLEERSRTIVTIDGQLLNDSIAIVETCCSEALSNGRPVDLYLRDITVVDPAGRSLLMRLADDGVRLVAEGVYLSFLIEELAADTQPSALPGPHARRKTRTHANGHLPAR